MATHTLTVGIDDFAEMAVPGTNVTVTGPLVLGIADGRTVLGTSVTLPTDASGNVQFQLRPSSEYTVGGEYEIIVAKNHVRFYMPDADTTFTAIRLNGGGLPPGGYPVQFGWLVSESSAFIPPDQLVEGVGRLNTDTGSIQWWDGTVWQSLAGGGGGAVKPFAQLGSSALPMSSDLGSNADSGRVLTSSLVQGNQVPDWKPFGAFLYGNADPSVVLTGAVEGTRYFRTTTPAEFWYRTATEWQKFHTFAQGGGGGITQAQLDAAIAAHAGMANVHHTPPDVSSFQTAAQVEALIDAEIVANPGGSGLTALTSITIGDTNYSLPQPSGGSGLSSQEYVVLRKLSGGEVGLWRIAQRRASDGRVFDIGGWLTASGTWAVSSSDAVDVSDALSHDDLFFLDEAPDVDYDDLSDKPVTRVQDYDDLPTPNASRLNRVYQVTSSGNLYVVSRKIIAGVDRVVDFTLFPVEAGGSAGDIRFQGSVDGRGDLPDSPTVADEGKWWMRRDLASASQAPFVEVDSNGNYQNLAHSPDSDHPYVGIFNTMDESVVKSNHEITASGQLVIFRDSSNVYQVYSVDSNFAAGTHVVEEYHYTKQTVDDFLLTRLDNLEASSPPVEVLFDNYGADSGLALAQGAWSWTAPIAIPLSRALVEADDDMHVELNLSFDATFTGGTVRRMNYETRFLAGIFRLMPAWQTGTTGYSSTGFPGSSVVVGAARLRLGDTGAGTDRNGLITRQRHTGGHDILAFMIPDGNTPHAPLSDIRARVTLER